MQTIVLVYQTLHRYAFYLNPAKKLWIFNTYFLNVLILGPTICKYIMKIHEENFQGLGKKSSTVFYFSNSSKMQRIWNMMPVLYSAGSVLVCLISESLCSTCEEIRHASLLIVSNPFGFADFWKCIMSKERLALCFVLCGKFF